MRKYYIQQKILKLIDHYPVCDENGEAVYQVDQHWTFFLYNASVTHADGRPAFEIAQEFRLFFPRFVLRYPDAKEIALQSQFSFFTMRINVEPEELGLEFRGDFFGLDYQLYQGGQLFASVHKVFWSLRDSFEITVYDESKTELVIGLVIMADHLLDSRKQQHS